MTLRSMLRNRLCNHNPFYLISAGLVLYGIHISFADRSSVADGWLLMRLLAGYTLLLLAAAVIVVKWAKVWEDARMILLVMVLTTVAISVGFDRFCLDGPAVGAKFLGVGFVFVIMITELTLTLLRIQLLWRYRLPFYVQFGLIFAYPVLLAHLSVTDQEDLMFRMVFLFPWLAALSLLLLLPSAFLGSPDEQNGTPWKWPAYPWPLFVGMLVALGVRSYGLTVSFELERGLSSGFQPFFLMPLVLAAVVLAAEIQARFDRTRALWWLSLAWITVPMCVVSRGDGVATDRYLEIIKEFGTPFQVVSLALVGIHLYACGRRFTGAEVGLFAGLFTMCLAFGRLDEKFGLPVPHQLLLGMTLTVLIGRGVWKRASLPVLLGIAIGLANLLVACPDVEWLPGRDAYYWLHWGVLSVFGVGLSLDDALARIVRRDSKWSLALLAVFAGAVYPEFYADIPPLAHFTYVGLLLMFATVSWNQERTVDWFCSVSACCVGEGLLVVFYLRRFIEQNVELAGVRWLLAGLAVLAIGLGVSLFKGGVVSRFWQRILLMHHRRSE